MGGAWTCASCGRAGRLTIRPRSKRDGVEDAALTPDGRRLAVALDSKFVEVWDVPGRRRLKRLDVGQDDVGWVAIRPDGAEVATAGFNGSLEITDVARETTRILVERHAYFDVAYSPDGRLLIATGRRESTVYDVRSGGGVAVLAGAIPTVAVDPAARRIAVSDRSRAPFIRRCDECGTWEQLLARADRRATRELTAAERRKYLGE